MRRTVWFIAPFAAAGLTALVLPWSSASAGEEPAFSGYNSSAWAAPVKVEFYEPTEAYFSRSWPLPDFEKV